MKLVFVTEEIGIAISFKSWFVDPFIYLFNAKLYTKYRLGLKSGYVKGVFEVVKCP